MKKLFFLLLVVNLVIWLWGQRDELARVTDTAQTGLGEIRLLDDAEVAARREHARQEAEVSPPAVIAGAGDAGVPPPASVAAAATVDPDLQRAAADGAVAPAADIARHAEPMPQPPVRSAAEPAVAAQDASAPPPEQSPVAAPGEQEQVSGAAPAAVAEILDTRRDALPEAPAVSEATAPAEPVDDGSPPAPVPPAVAAPHLVLEDASVPAQPVDDGSPPAPVPPPVAAPHLVLEDASVPVEPAAVAASPEPAAIAPSPGTSAAPAEPVAPPVEARGVLYLCESIGPFAERSAAVRFQAGVAAPLRGATVREERSSRPVRQWVLAPVQPSKEATAEYLTSLSQAGVKDAWRIPNGPLAGRLAVGVFQSAENARKHADMLAAKGVASEIQAPKDLEPIRVYWVDYERPADAPPPDVGVGRPQPPRQVVSRSCGRVAGP